MKNLISAIRPECGNRATAEKEIIASDTGKGCDSNHHHHQPQVLSNGRFSLGLFLAWLNDSPGSNLTLTWNRTLGLICESREADNTSPCVLCCCSRSRYIYNWLTHSAAAFSIFLQFPNVWIYLMALMPHFLVGFVRNCSRCDSRRVIKICVPSRCNFSLMAKTGGSV